MQRFPKVPHRQPIPLATGLAPSLVLFIEIMLGAEFFRANDALLLKESSQHVLLLTIVLRRVRHGQRRTEPLRLPRETARDGPVQDPGPFVLELCGKLLVLFRIRNGHRKGNAPNPAPHRVVRAADRGAMIRANKQFELRHETEELLMQLSRRNLIAAREAFDQPLGELLALLRLQAGHQSRSHQGRDIIRDASVMALDQERFGTGRLTIIASQIEEGEEERAFPVAANAKENEKALFRGQPRQRIPEDPLEIVGNLRPRVEQPLQ